MPDSILIEYLSELGCGSWGDLRRAIAGCPEICGRPAVWVAEDLMALGHIEIDSTSLRWSLCPPSLAELPIRDSAGAVLCGARTTPFLRTLRDAAEQLGVTVSSDAVEGAVTERIMIDSAHSDAIEQLAGELGLPLHRRAAARLSQLLPSIDSLVRAAPVEPVPSAVERWDDDSDRPTTASWRWEPCQQALSPGLYRQRWVQRWEYWWVHAGVSRRVSKAV